MTQPLEAFIRQIQAAVKWGDGNPNGIVDAVTGCQYQDRATGDVYRKTSPKGTLTGWVTP